jgi:hypothetical protein
MHLRDKRYYYVKENFAIIGADMIENSNAKMIQQGSFGP